jgi:hypothetical protein
MVQPEREAMTSLFSIHALNPRTCTAFVHCRFTAAQCSTVLVQPEHEWRRSLLQHAHASTHAHALLLSTADSLRQCSTVLQPERSTTPATSACTRPNPHTYVLLCPLRYSLQLSAARSGAA